MSLRTEELARSATEERARLSDAFVALEREVDELTDWRTHVRKEPIVPIGIAVATGMVVGMLTSPRGVPAYAPAQSRGKRNASGSRRSSVRSSVVRKLGTVAIEMLAARAVAVLMGRLRR